MLSAEQFQLADAPRAARAGAPLLSTRGLVIFGAAHAPLAILMFNFPEVASLHALATIAVSLWLAVFGRRLKHVAYAGAYVVSAEVLWRMADAQVLWETGKYATALVFVLALLRLRSARGAALPAWYFALLLPSVLPVLMEFGLAGARKPISFNLSGPLALLVSARFFAHLTFSREDLRRLFLSALGPIFGIAAITVFTILTNPEIVFTGESNREVTGGFGPNQVSAILGLGVLLALFCALYEEESRRLKLLMFGVIAFFSMQAAMTFSRGGLYNAVGASLIALVFLLKDGRARFNLVIAAALLFASANYLVLPQLDAFTDGALTARFENVDPTGRWDLLVADLNIWSDNPIFGVGPGQATALREELMLVAHTEFSRLLSEHGAFGFAALVALLLSGAQCFRQAGSVRSRALVAALIGWSFLFMLNAAMRMVAPSFVFGLAFATFALGEESAAADESRRRAEQGPQVVYW
ncbi:MAG: O-antigen ligase family protein [Pyrinomonadaceae bacterium]